jgi:hypothetical protein
VELLQLGDWRDLRPGMNVLCVSDAEQHRQLVLRLSAALGGAGPADPGLTRARIAGTDLTLDVDIRSALQRGLGTVSPIIGGGAPAAAASLDPAETAIRSALEIDNALAVPGARPRAAGPEAVQRLAMLETRATSEATGHMNVLETDVTKMERALDELVHWRDGLLRGYARIEEAIAGVAATEDDTKRRMAGPAAFNKHLDAKADRDRVIKEVGFASYDVFVSENKHVLDDAARRIAAQQSDLESARQKIYVERNKTIGPVHAEIELLSLHVRFDSRVSGAEAESPRHRNLIRRSLRSPLSTLLRSMAIEPGEDSVVTAAHWLDSKTASATQQAGGRLSLELSMQGRIHSLAAVPSLGPVPAILDDPLSSLDGPDAQAVFGSLVDMAQRGHQMLYVCSYGEATRVSPIAHLFVRQPGDAAVSTL